MVAYEVNILQKFLVNVAHPIFDPFFLKFYVILKILSIRASPLDKWTACIIPYMKCCRYSLIREIFGFDFEDEAKTRVYRIFQQMILRFEKIMAKAIFSSICILAIGDRPYLPNTIIEKLVEETITSPSKYLAFEPSDTDACVEEVCRAADISELHSTKGGEI